MYIPGESDWEGAKDSKDLDLPYAYKIFNGKSNAEVQKDFKRCVLERSAELRVMPPIPFRYYMIGFRDFVMADDFDQFEKSDAASSYLLLIKAKLESSASDILPIFDELIDSIRFIANNQTAFDADVDIYGSFEEIEQEIMELFGMSK